MRTAINPIDRVAVYALFRSFGPEQTHAQIMATNGTPDRTSPRLDRFARDQFLAGGITMASILLLVGTFAAWVQTNWRLLDLIAPNPSVTATALILNIALILLGWRRFVDINRNLSRFIEMEAEARERARLDPLCGFLNRSAFFESGELLFDDWRQQGLTPAAIMIDLDGFKTVNDLFGHAHGDQMLALTAERIRSCQPADAIVGRIGGDEFAMLLPIGKDSHSLDHYCDVLTQVLSHSITIDGASISTSGSVGGAAAQPETGGLKETLRQADEAMYAAKRAGRSRYVVFDARMRDALGRRDLVETQLRRALDQGELYPVYEAQIDLSTNQPIGYEMLARWESPVLGTVAPAEFIPVAEETGLIARLSETLIRQALQEAGQWPDNLSLSVNISPLQLRDPWFAQKLLKLVAETGFPAARLIVEITESALVDNMALAQATFASLRNQGIRLALDDFGTGYSSVASLRALKFDTIKLDREFVTRMDNDQSRSAIAEAVLHLGRSIGVPVVAEGIESVDTATMLAGFDCAIGQGHFYSRELRHADVLNAHSTPVTGIHAAGDATASPVADRRTA